MSQGGAMPCPNSGCTLRYGPVSMHHHLKTCLFAPSPYPRLDTPPKEEAFRTNNSNAGLSPIFHDEVQTSTFVIEETDVFLSIEDPRRSPPRKGGATLLLSPCREDSPDRRSLSRGSDASGWVSVQEETMVPRTQSVRGESDATFGYRRSLTSPECPSPGERMSRRVSPPRDYDSRLPTGVALSPAAPVAAIDAFSQTEDRMNDPGNRRLKSSSALKNSSATLPSSAAVVGNTPKRDLTAKVAQSMYLPASSRPNTSTFTPKKYRSMTALSPQQQQHQAEQDDTHNLVSNCFGSARRITTTPGSMHQATVSREPEQHSEVASRRLASDSEFGQMEDSRTGSASSSFRATPKPISQQTPKSSERRPPQAQQHSPYEEGAIAIVSMRSIRKAKSEVSNAGRTSSASGQQRTGSPTAQLSRGPSQRVVQF